MAAVETPSAVDLVRTASQSSTASNPRKNGTTRVRPLKKVSNTSLGRAPSPAEDTKSLTSFPSLSPTPESSPVQSRANGWFRNISGGSQGGSKNGGAKSSGPTSSPDTVIAVSPPEHPKGPISSSAVRNVTKSTQQLVGSLVSATPSVRNRSALFDDTPPELVKVPGNLHISSDANIEEALARMGAVALVQQLAGDLAQRDAQITASRRRAEERERILRKMLQECEVSNMDIENRLRELDRGRDQGVSGSDLKLKKRGGDQGLPGMHPEDPIDQRIARAMEDEVTEFPYVLGLDGGSTTPGADGGSVVSASDAARETGRGNWKSYLWAGTNRKSSRTTSVASSADRIPEGTSVQTRSRASSGAKQTRKPISNDLFLPPSNEDQVTGAIPTLRRLQSKDQIQSSTSSRRPSVSIANWALKMVAGNHQAGRNTDKGTAARGRKSNASDSADRAPSMDSTLTTHSNKSGPKRTARASLGPNGTIKSITSDLPKNAMIPTPPVRGESTLGPVEMDRILPEESRPPTLMQHHSLFGASHEYLTDRFGFIYDQRRKKRQSEAAAALIKQKRNSNVESLGDRKTAFDIAEYDEVDTAKLQLLDSNSNSRPTSRPGSISSGEPATGQVTKTWQDYLKLATHPTELLSHTPSTAPLMETPETDITPPKVSQVTLVKRGSLPSSSVNPEPFPSRIVSGNAEFVVTSPSGPSTPISPMPPQADPVKALLEQLTDLHDSLQREKTVVWNDFLRKVRAERKREGEAASAGEGRQRGLTMPEAFLTDGEIIGIAGLGNKGKLGRAKWQEFRKLVLGGIPVAHRAKIWAECSGASALRVPGYYNDLVDNGDDNPAIVAQIQMDITRTLTDNIFFRKGPGVRKLNEVLLAYSRRNPEVGYCQGMNLITACLLLIMPTAEDAFWVLTTMVENILPEKYYDQQLLTSRADQTVLREYVVELLPKLSNHLDILEVELEALTFQWFLSVFTDCLSAEALFRVWDVVLCMHDGSTFLFQVALALLKLNEKALLQCDTSAGVYHYINHQMTNHAISIDGLIQASDALGRVIKRKDVEERRERAVAHEQELMRQREEARLERARKKAMKDTNSGAISIPAPLNLDYERTGMSASLDAELSMQTSPMRTPLSSASRRSEEEEEEAELVNRSLEDLASRTPMPIEEEFLWRA